MALNSYIDMLQSPGEGGTGDTVPGTPVAGPDDSPSLTAQIKPEKCSEHLVGDLNGDCQLSTYETCLKNGNSQEVCACVADGGDMLLCAIEDCLGEENQGDSEGTSVSFSISALNFNQQVLSQIYTYLITQNQCSEEARANIIETLLNPYTEIEDDLISFNLIDDECAKQVIWGKIFGNSATIGTNAGFINTIRNLFSNDENVTLVFRDDDDVPSDANASTDFDEQSDIDSGTYNIIITFSNTYLNGNPTKLSIALTAIHESLHAKLMYSYLHGTLLTEYPTYTSLNSKFQLFLNDRNPTNADALNDAMHGVMTDFIGTMSYSLFKYAQNEGMNNITEDYCKKITKGSFYGTPGMNNIDTGNDTAEDLNNMYTNEQENNTDAQGDDC